VTIVVAAVVTALTSLLRMGMRGYVAAVINGSMQLTVFDHLERLPYSYYKKNKSGDLDPDLHPRPRCPPQIPDRRCLELQLDLLDGVLLLRILDEHLLEDHPRRFALFPLMFLYSFFLIKKCAISTASPMIQRRQDDRQDLREPRRRPHRQSLQRRALRDRFLRETLTDYKRNSSSWRKLSAFFFSSSDIFVFGSKLAALLLGHLPLLHEAEINAGTWSFLHLRQHDGLAVTRCAPLPYPTWANTSPRATGSASFLKNRSKIRPPASPRDQRRYRLRPRRLQIR
jgi:hypothetical protein